MEKGKICYACLQPKDICVIKKCKFESKIPETLKCHGCAPWSRSKDLDPFSILFCRNKEHAQLRASFPEMKKDLEKYIGKLGTTVLDSSIKYSANYTYQVFSLSPGNGNVLGWVQEDFKNNPAPSINSETGKLMEVLQESVIPEVLEQSCYLMQTIRIGGSEVLVFFYRGANVHIIDGLLAEKEGLQKVSSTPNALTVVGGDKIYSDHGTFRFNLGPGDNDEYHEIVCIGMNDVTAGFGSYNLSEIAREYREYAEPDEKNEVLPEKVGGSKVHLLLGIKNTKLDPVLLKILPSGVAVYRSPFRDVFESRVIFGGLHKSFKNDPAGVMMSNAVFLMQAVDNELPGDQEQDEVELINFFDHVPGAGKGAAEELLIDLDHGEPRTNQDKDLMDYQGFWFQSHLNKEGYLETLLDISSPELNEPSFQPGARSMDMETSLLDISSPELNEPVLQPGAGSINMKNPERNRTQDGSGFRISELNLWNGPMEDNHDISRFQESCSQTCIS